MEMRIGDCQFLHANRLIDEAGRSGGSMAQERDEESWWKYKNAAQTAFVISQQFRPAVWDGIKSQEARPMEVK